MQQMMLLLVEDESHYRLEFKEYIKTLSPTLGYPVSFYMAEGESEALSLVQKFPFDAIILDLELHESDGDGLIFLKKLTQLKLPDKPYVVVATHNRSPVVREDARTGGADYVFWKGKRDYSPKLVMEHICTVYDYKTKKQSKTTVKVKKQLSLEDEIKLRIDKIGFTDDMLGKKYVNESVSIVTQSNKDDINLHRDVFPIIAKRYNKSVGSVNRAIETAINKAWCITGDETLNEFYPAAVSGSKGTPTNKEFIFTLANEFKKLCRA